jgi:YVTN family beta-propeller protein
MTFRIGGPLALPVFVCCVLATIQALAQNAYVTNVGSNTVSVIATATNTVIGSPIPVGSGPIGVAVTPDGSKVYVANQNSGTVSVIATATNTVIGPPIPVGSTPTFAAVTPDGSKVYVVNQKRSTAPWLPQRCRASSVGRDRSSSAPPPTRRWRVVC